jgi:hypothetical protein
MQLDQDQEKKKLVTTTKPAPSMLPVELCCQNVMTGTVVLPSHIFLLLWSQEEQSRGAEQEPELQPKQEQDRMKSGNNSPIEVKVCIIGESDVGKTSLSMR